MRNYRADASDASMIHSVDSLIQREKSDERREKIHRALDNCVEILLERSKNKEDPEYLTVCREVSNLYKLTQRDTEIKLNREKLVTREKEIYLRQADILLRLLDDHIAREIASAKASKREKVQLLQSRLEAMLDEEPDILSGLQRGPTNARISEAPEECYQENT